MMKTAKNYTDNIYRAAVSNWPNLFGTGCVYHGKDGALRFAREYGYGLKDFPQKEAKDEIKSTYSTLCVRLYLLKPPIGAKEWNAEIKKAMLQ